MTQLLFYLLLSFLNPIYASILNEVPGALVGPRKNCLENVFLSRKHVEDKMSSKALKSSTRLYCCVLCKERQTFKSVFVSCLPNL